MMLEYLLPWDFSPTVLAAVTLAAVLFYRGAHGTGLQQAQRAPEPMVPATRQAAFYAGLALIYAALQTRWDYYAGHMFFVHRLQHFALHDVGPFLLAWSAPAVTLAAGCGASCQRLLRKARAAMSDRKRALLALPIRVIFDPFTATALFVGSLCFWVWPPIHFYAMLSNWVYMTMNLSVVILDLPFWWLILDPRSYPQSRLGQGKRIAMLAAVMMPMILVGAVIGLSRRDLYPSRAPARCTSRKPRRCGAGVRDAGTGTRGSDRGLDPGGGVGRLLICLLSDRAWEGAHERAIWVVDHDFRARGADWAGYSILTASARISAI